MTRLGHKGQSYNTPHWEIEYLDPQELGNPNAIDQTTAMKHVTCYLPQNYIGAANNLVRKGAYPNRSEFFRKAIRNLLEEHGVQL
jgi:hypothetical protein